MDAVRFSLTRPCGNFAEDPDTEHPPLRLRRIKKPRTIPQAYTHEQIRLHLSEAAKMRGRHPDNNWRADWWQAVLEAAYSTGLRRGDLLRLRWGDVSPRRLVRMTAR